MKVKLWNDVEIAVKNRNEAIHVIKNELKGWMNLNDKLGWYFYSSKKNAVENLPDMAYVHTPFGERTDAYALITL